MNRTIQLSEFIDAYKESLGEEKAAKMLLESTMRVDLSGQNVFNTQEAILICKDLQEKSGFIGTVAGVLLARFRTYSKQ